MPTRMAQRPSGPSGPKPMAKLTREARRDGDKKNTEVKEGTKDKDTPKNDATPAANPATRPETAERPEENPEGRIKAVKTTGTDKQKGTKTLP